MLTRAILLLLAMMTGLSAAQAAETVRPAQGTAELRASASLPSAARAALDVKRQALSQAGFARAEPKLFGEALCFAPAPADAPAVPCVYRADRARE